MKSRLLNTLMFAAFILSATLFAHDEFRFVGTITERVDDTLTVKTQQGDVVAMGITKNTLIYRNKKEVPVTELKPGRTVVVRALGDSLDSFEVFEITIVPAIKAPPRK